MADNNWDMYSEEMEEDLTMEDVEDEEMEVSSGGEKTIYPEDFIREVSSPGLATPINFSRFDTSSISPIHSFGETIDEKGEAIALLMHLEKTIVHQDFFNDFQDDFDEDDYA